MLKQYSDMCMPGWGVLSVSYIKRWEKYKLPSSDHIFYFPVLHSLVEGLLELSTLTDLLKDPMWC